MTPVQIALISACISACAIVIGATSAFLAYRSLRSTHEWNRRKAAQDAALLFNQRVQGRDVLDEQLNYVSSSEPIGIETLHQKFAAVAGLKPAIHSLLNYFEMLARGVHQSIYDETVIRVAWKGAMTRAMERFGPYIKERRTASPAAWRELEGLVSKWRHQETQVTERAPTG